MIIQYIHKNKRETIDFIEIKPVFQQILHNMLVNIVEHPILDSRLLSKGLKDVRLTCFNMPYVLECLKKIHNIENNEDLLANINFLENNLNYISHAKIEFD